MGACLLLQGVVIKERKADCLKRINKLDWSDVDDMFNHFENAGIWIDEDEIRERMPDEELAGAHAEDPEDPSGKEAFDKEAVKWMKERLIEAVQVVYDCHHHGSRDVDFINVDGLGQILITGGATWGDNPTDEMDDFNLFNELLGYPYWAKPNSKERKDWEKIGRKK